MKIWTNKWLLYIKKWAISLSNPAQSMFPFVMKPNCHFKPTNFYATLCAFIKRCSIIENLSAYSWSIDVVLVQNTHDQNGWSMSDRKPSACTMYNCSFTTFRYLTNPKLGFKHRFHNFLQIYFCRIDWTNIWQAVYAAWLKHQQTSLAIQQKLGVPVKNGSFFDSTEKSIPFSQNIDKCQCTAPSPVAGQRRALANADSEHDKWAVAFMWPGSVAQKNKTSTMLSFNVQSIDLPVNYMAWRFWRWDNWMAAQHLPRDLLVQPNNRLKELAETTKKKIDMSAYFEEEKMLGCFALAWSFRWIIPFVKRSLRDNE